jgi:hypothetical protein
MSATGRNIPRALTSDRAHGIIRIGRDIQVTTQALCDLRSEERDRMRTTWSIGIVIVAASAAVSAQSGHEMAASMMGDKANLTYTGCVESVNHGGTYLLTDVAHDHETAMGRDSMMKKDAAMTMKDGTAASSDMHEDHMMPTSLILTGSSDLKKHVGQKVTVTGAVSKASMDGGMKDDHDTLTVASLKVVGKACK